MSRSFAILLFRLVRSLKLTDSDKTAAMSASQKVITTHSGSFHADESLAVSMLQLLPEYRNASIVRTRDPAMIAQGDIVVDVGGEYLPEKLRFDHHQRGFKETFNENYDILLSSAGLVYKHFGQRVIAELLKWQASDPRLPVVYQKIYDDFVLAFDGIDNGVSQYDASLKPRYRDSTNASGRVSKLNPWWNETNVDYQERFLKAVAMVGAEFQDRVRYTALAWLPGRELVVSALAARRAHDPQGRIMVLARFCPWKEHLHLLEEEQKIPEAERPLYVLYEDDTAKQWRIQAVSISPESFTSRKPLPEPWRGIRDQALSDLTGIPGGVFVHASGFIGGNQTKEGAMKMAQTALTINSNLEPSINNYTYGPKHFHTGFKWRCLGHLRPRHAAYCCHALPIRRKLRLRLTVLPSPHYYPQPDTPTLVGRALHMHLSRELFQLAKLRVPFEFRHIRQKVL
ncbi:hypothetical protein HDU90_006938 [Geranomyces variabilis]|nr:hypothetical protein HDU90_006938 [Geranomyces variabilis]